MRRSGCFRRVAWLVVVSLLVPTWLGHMATVKATQQVDGLVICTGAGFKVVPWPDDKNSTPANDGSNHPDGSLNCAACLYHAVGKLNFSALPVDVAWSVPMSTHAVTDQAWRPRPDQANASRPRAPPVS